MKNLLKRFGLIVFFAGLFGGVFAQSADMDKLFSKYDNKRHFEKFEYDGYRITNFEMEGSALAGMARKLGHDAITVCAAIAHRYLKDANTDYKSRVNELVKLVMDKLTA